MRQSSNFVGEMPPLRDVGLTSAARSVLQRMACKRAPRRREHDCDILGHVTRPSLRAGGDRARSEGPGGAEAIRPASGELGATRGRIALERELERVPGSPR
jgi:hypothetical protein